MADSDAETLNLQLGDVIEILAPDDTELDNKKVLIKYLDSEVIEAVGADGEEVVLAIDDGQFRNESIEAINLLSRADDPGYARQNNLLPGQWINVFFGGDIPVTVTGKVTDIDGDQIEVKLVEGDEVIYLDFAYKGIPKEIPIDKIVLREAPEATAAREATSDPEATAALEAPSKDDDEQAPVGIATPENQEDDLQAPEEEDGDVFQARAKTLYMEADQIQLGPALGRVAQEVEVPEDEKRYGINKQTTDMLNELLSKIPTNQRTPEVMNHIHLMIERFEQLRTEFSQFDSLGNALMPAIKGADYKPLVKTLDEMNQKLYWLLPVVRDRKKVYDIDDAELVGQGLSDVVALTLAESRTEEDAINSAFRGNRIPDGQNGYSYFIKEMSKFWEPFLPPSSDSEVLASKPVGTNITVVADNQGDMFSTAVKRENLDRVRFLIQEYNLGEKGLSKTKNKMGETILKGKVITRPEQVPISGLLTLPKATISFSHVNLPSTNIMTKAGLNATFFDYWRVLSNRTQVTTKVIEELGKPYPHETETFLSGYDHYIMSEDVLERNKAEGQPVYKGFLESLVPKTRVLFDLLKDSIEGKMTIQAILGYLEPFMIYHKDLSFTQYNEMNQFIVKKIGQFKADYASAKREFAAIPSSKGRPVSVLERLLTTQRQLIADVRSAYPFLEDKVERSETEQMRLMSAIDYGRVLNNAVAMAGSSLMTGDGEEMILDAKREVEDTAALVNRDAECDRVLAKRYIDYDELEEDDGRDIYFDKRYDPTFYDVALAYKSDLEMLPDRDEKIKFLMTMLQDRNGLPADKAMEDAQAMVDGRKLVRDGQYAVLVTEENGTAKYFKREAGVWVRDDSIDDDTFAQTAKDFCNVSTKCIEVKDQCMDLKRAEATVLADNLDKAIAEFDISIAASSKQIMGVIQAELENTMARSSRLLEMVKKAGFRYDLARYKIGQTTEETVAIESPYAALRDLILAQGDFVKRQSDVGRFVTKFTRPSSTGEDEYWLYCITTDTKLMPTFLSRLATAYLNHGDYLLTLRRIAAEQGELSGDGASVVDKHSGYTIMMQEADTDEGYTEEGFRIQTREVLEADLGDAVVATGQVAKKDKYDTPEAISVHNVAKTLARFTGLSPTEADMDSIVVSSVKLLAIANKTLKEAAEKNEKAAAMYETKYDRQLVSITAGYFLVYVQTAIPSLKTKKTHPGCKRSFGGYPTFAGQGDETGLDYLVCIINDVKGAIKPWSGLAKLGKKGIATNIKAMLDAFTLKEDTIRKRIAAKIEYGAIEARDEVPEEHRIETWGNFLPPLAPIKVGAVEPFPESFTEGLLDDLKTGSADQFKKIATMQAKIMTASLGIQEGVQAVVKADVRDNQPILANASSEPYLENACCDAAGLNTLAFFEAKQKSITMDNALIKRVRNTLDDLGAMAQAPILFDPNDTRRFFPKIPTDFSEDTIYRAFIEFCKFNFDLPVSDDLRAVCMDKPDDFDAKDSMADKIRKLKRDGKNYDNAALQQLMLIINKGNIVKLSLKIAAVSNVQRLRDLLESFDDRESKSVPSSFRTKFYAMLETFEIGGLEEDTAQMRDMKNYLSAANTKMTEELDTFVRKNMRKGDSDKFVSCLKALFQFPTSGNSMTMEEEDETVFRAVQFAKNSIAQVGRILPTTIINGVDYSNVRPPAHWKLSDWHARDFSEIVRKYYAPIAGFYEDAGVKQALATLRQSVADICLLADNTVFFAPIKVNDKYQYSVFDRRLTLMLFNFYFLSVLSEFSALYNDETVLRSIVMGAPEASGRNLFTQAEIASMENGLMTQVMEGEQKKLETSIAACSVGMMQIICSDKDAVKLDYSQLMERVLRAKEKEKDLITDYLKEMTDEQREVEDIFKAQKLGKWGVGEQKGFRTYQAATYDQERMDMERQMEKEARLGKMDAVTAMNRDIYGYEMDIRDAEAQAIEAEEADLSYLGEDNDNAGEEYDDNDGY